MNKYFLIGIKFVLGVLLIIGLLFVVYGSGWHVANEILPGIFTGNFIFIGNTSFNGSMQVANFLSLKNITTPSNESGYAKVYFKFITEENITPVIDNSTKLLIHADGVGNTFVDSSLYTHSITANGDVTQVNTKFKFGTKSTYFDGTGDYLTLSSSSDWDFGSENWTIEFWTYPTVAQDSMIFNNWNVGGPATSYGGQVAISSTGAVNYLYIHGATGYTINILSATGLVPINNWSHVALTRSGNVFTIYVNGISVGSQTVSQTFTSGNQFTIGARYYQGAYDSLFIGYIDEFRVSKGIARYTSNFTPPTSAFVITTPNSINMSSLYFLDEKNIERRVIISNDIYDNLGNIGVGTLTPQYKLDVNGTVYATGAAGSLSDVRHKKNIQNLSFNALNIIKNLNPVSYEWITPIDSGMRGVQLGFIAQEVEEVLPQAILTQDNLEQTKAIKYNELIPVLTKAIQEQQNLIDDLIENQLICMGKISVQLTEIEQLKEENKNKFNEIKQDNDEIQALKLEVELFKLELCKKDSSYTFC